MGGVVNASWIPAERNPVGRSGITATAAVLLPDPVTGHIAVFVRVRRPVSVNALNAETGAVVWADR